MKTKSKPMKKETYKSPAAKKKHEGGESAAFKKKEKMS
jgi:hypothetical protein